MGARTFSFLHAADLHLDSPLRGLTRYPGAPVAELRGATRAAFQNLVTLALERHVQFVVIAGDLFDGEWRDYNTGLWFTAEVRRLVGAGIPLYFLRGNHDAESRLTKHLAWPAGAFEFPTDAPLTMRVEGLDVALHGQGFEHRDELRNLAQQYPAAISGHFNIGVLHTALTGYEGHDSYAPCTHADLAARGYDYWALGHIHQREVVSKDPWVVFPGNLQGRHVRELGPKGATLVHVEEGQITSLELIECDIARWAHVEVEVGPSEHEAALMSQIRASLAEAADAADGRLVAARVTLRGTTPLDGALRVQRDRIESEVRSLAADVAPELWIERVRFETQSPARIARHDAGFRALADRIEAATIEADEAESLARAFTRFADDLPMRVTASIQPKDPAQLLALAPEAARYLAALLVAESPRVADDSDDESSLSGEAS